MNQNSNSYFYNLEKRTLDFAKNIRSFIKNLNRNFIYLDDYKQLLRASGSVGANYIEANESLSKKDFLMRLKICRKEARESAYWLQIIEINDQELEKLRLSFFRESIELTKIFSSIIQKSKFNIKY